MPGRLRLECVADFTGIGTDPYDLIVLDNMLSKKDGITDLDELRGEGIATPVLMLTTKSDVTNPVKKLDLGTDDYLHKPFSLAELLALIRAPLRRSHEQISSSLIIGNIRMDTNTRIVENPQPQRRHQHLCSGSIGATRSTRHFAHWIRPDNRF